MKTGYIINIIFPIFFFNGCSSNGSLPLNLQEYLLYIEDVDGRDGTTAGDFGDIIALNLKNGKRYRITDDSYYDEHPTYSSKLNTILFESKRIGYNSIAGLGSESDLFYFKLNKKIPELISFNDSKDAQEKQQYNFDFPQFDKTGSNFAFISLNLEGFRNSLLYYKVKADTLILLTDSLISPLTYIFSENTNIYFTSKVSDKFGLLPNSINSINIKTKVVKTVIPPQHSHYYYLGDEKNNKLLYLDNDISNFDDLTNFSINIFDLQISKNEIITTSDQLSLIEIKPPVFANDSTIYFIGNKAKKAGQFDEDIYQLNIKTKEVKQITDNGHIKESLYYCR